MFDGFARRRIAAPGAEINLVVGGSGPPLLLLHGYPQTLAIWHAVAPKLAERFTVVCADLRGYGDSGKPPSGEAYANYSKRAMAADQVAAMQALGFDRFGLAGHDRGGRVGHRRAADHPQRVSRLCIIDIAPTLHMYERTTEAFARAYWHWFFLILPPPEPERMIGADPEAYWRAKCGADRPGAPFAPEALAEYLRCFRDPAAIRASCDDYRAAAGIDLAHDRADVAAGRRLACPVHVLWGDDGIIGRCFDPLAAWRERADRVSGRALPGGHYLPEERPELVTAALAAFFGDG
ncbi:MAG: alpha/beta hydrolase [Alphaproteobacteria bacterium]